MQIHLWTLSDEGNMDLSAVERIHEDLSGLHESSLQRQEESAFGSLHKSEAKTLVKAANVL